jgi:hypothetical protein
VRDHWLATVRLTAYLLTVEVDAWRVLCAELGIDADFLLSDLPAYDTVGEAEPLARELAYTPEEAEAHLRQGAHPAKVVTVEELVALLRQTLEKLAEW